MKTRKPGWKLWEPTPREALELEVMKYLNAKQIRHETIFKTELGFLKMSWNGSNWDRQWLEVQEWPIKRKKKE